jgi:hypothetical protein
MNAEVRDHLNFLKGFADLITNSTTADTGTATSLSITRAATSDLAYRSLVSGDTQPRFQVQADGRIAWGPGGATVLDTNFRRVAAGILRGDDSTIGSERIAGTTIALQALVTGDSVGRFNVFASGDVQWSGGATTADVLLTRPAAGILRMGTNGVATAAIMRVQGEAAQQTQFDVLITGDTASRLQMRGDATLTGLVMGPGNAALDANLYRSAVNQLKTDDQLVAADGIVTKTVAGAVSDASFTVTPPVGAIAIDTTNLRIYVRTAAAVWKSVVVA